MDLTACSRFFTHPNHFRVSQNGKADGSVQAVLWLHIPTSAPDMYIFGSFIFPVGARPRHASTTTTFQALKIAIHHLHPFAGLLVVQLSLFFRASILLASA